MNCKFIRIVIFLDLLTLLFACRAGRLIRNGLVNYIDKYEILKYHNEFRNDVALGKIPRQPGAENMLEMRWDDELAQVAQSWADRCVYSHNQDRAIPRFAFGENLALELNTDTTELRGNGNEFPFRVKSWFEEHKLYTFGQKFSRETGHYTQIIWADSYLVGCGFTYYKGTDDFYTRFYVCNYGPAGNIRGQNPYITGNPSCSKYGLNLSQQYRGLCQVSTIVSNAGADNIISNDIEFPAEIDSVVTHFTPTTTKVYTTKVAFQPTRERETFVTFNKFKSAQHQTTILPYQMKPKIISLELDSNQPTRTKSINRPTLETKVREIDKNTQQLPTTTITAPFSPTVNQANNQTVIRNVAISPSYQFTPLPITTRPPFLPNIASHDVEARVYNRHRDLLNYVFRQQQQRTALFHSYLINSSSKWPYFTYKWSDPLL